MLCQIQSQYPQSEVGMTRSSEEDLLCDEVSLAAGSSANRWQSGGLHVPTHEDARCTPMCTT